MTDEEWHRDGTLISSNGVEIDLRNADGSVWITIKTNTNKEATELSARLLGFLND